MYQTTQQPSVCAGELTIAAPTAGARAMKKLLAAVGWALLCCTSRTYAKSHIDEAIRYANSHHQDFLTDLKDLVRFPTVSASAEQQHTAFTNAVDWLKRKVTSIGFQNAQALTVDGAIPSVYADWLNAGAAAPTILLYGHYDVQPAEPLALWHSPPFEAEVRAGYMYGRGVSDCKGTMLQALHGLESLLRTGNKQLPINVKLLLEGEEEIGSPHLAQILQRHEELLKADAVICSDGGQISDKQPGMCLGFRGMVGLQVTLHTLTEDVHSGLWGGTVHNAALALAQLLTTLHTPTGAIAVEHYLRDVREMTAEDRDDVTKYPDDTAEAMSNLGVVQPHGEQGFSVIERTWYRPSIDVVGMYSGHTGEGMKTILPAEATAKISSRLVPDQDPKRCQQLIKEHLLKHKPPTANLTFVEEHYAWPYVGPRESFSNRAAAQVLQSVMGAAPLYERSGGTIPALTTLKQVLGMDTTVFAFALPDNRVHAPNEQYSVSFYKVGVEAYIRLMYQLQKMFAEEQGKTASKDEL